jgi:hypothetical protein
VLSNLRRRALPDPFRLVSEAAVTRLARRYRATGADAPFGDPRRAHGVGMEGYFWRFSDVRSGRVIVALCGVSQAPDGTWANVGLAGHPGAFSQQFDISTAGADSRRLGVWAGEHAFRGGLDRVQVELGPEARLDVRVSQRHDWPRLPVGGCGAAHLLPGLGQYWHPHLLGGRADGVAVLGGEVIELDGFSVYAEKNWGRGGFPGAWHWGQAQAFERPDVCVAFAGGDVVIGPATVQATALVVALGDELIRLGNPLIAPVRAEVDATRWVLSGRGPRYSVELEGTAPRGPGHLLNVPLPSERRSVPAALEHLAGHLRLVVRRRGRVCFTGESRLAGLEVGPIESGRAG